MLDLVLDLDLLDVVGHLAPQVPDAVPRRAHYLDAEELLRRQPRWEQFDGRVAEYLVCPTDRGVPLVGAVDRSQSYHASPTFPSKSV